MTQSVVNKAKSILLNKCISLCGLKPLDPNAFFQTFQKNAETVRFLWYSEIIGISILFLIIPFDKHVIFLTGKSLYLHKIA